MSSHCTCHIGGHDHSADCAVEVDRREAQSDLNERRGAFLAGEGTLSFREVVEWSRELGYPCRENVLLAMVPTDPMMVSVLPSSWPDSWKPRRKDHA